MQKSTLTRLFILVATFAGLLFAIPAAAVTGRIVCTSQNNQQSVCSVRTDNRVQLVRELPPGNRCRQNHTWGFSERDIWVSNGCRAEFEFGRGIGRPSSGAALAPGILQLLSWPQGGSPSFAPQATRGPVNAPGWAVGSFSAWDVRASDTVLLNIDGRGRVLLRNGRGQVVAEGELRQGVVRWNNGRDMWLGREGFGLVLGTMAGGSSEFSFRRG